MIEEIVSQKHFEKVNKNMLVNDFYGFRMTNNERGSTLKIIWIDLEMQSGCPKKAKIEIWNFPTL